MSSKTVKVTSGKIINYTITAPGYKTINGSQLITADTTINKNMVAEVDPNGVYSLGDRIGNIASFVCYFNSINPDTNVQQRYAVFALDAKYRAGTQYCGYNEAPNLPYYANQNDALSATESATYNTTKILNGTHANPFLAFVDARNAAILNLNVNNNNIIIQSQLPNIYELNQIFSNRVVLENLDPTVSDFSTYSLTNWGTTITPNNGTPSAISSTCLNASFAYRCYAVNPGGGIITCDIYNRDGRAYYTPNGLIIPVFEIPVE